MVGPRLFHQLVVAADFYDLALFEHDNPIRMTNAAEAMRNDHDEGVSP